MGISGTPQATGDAQLAARVAALEAAFPLGVAAWTAWTPTLANLTLGNGTQTARYQRIGRLIVFRYKLVLGSTSAVGTGPTFTLPVAATGYTSLQDCIGPVVLIDTGTANYTGQAFTNNTVAAMYMLNSTATLSAITATFPFTWTTNDVLACTGTYEAAA